MAETKNSKQQEPSGKKGFPVKTVIILGVFLVLEVATVFVVLMLTGQPAQVKAEHTLQDEAAQLEVPVEELVVEDKFVNVLRGETIIYNTEIYVVVRRKHQAKIEQDIEQMKARITTDIANIIKMAVPAYFAEPTHATLARQIKAALDERFGQDMIAGRPYVEEVLIKKMIPFRADN